MPAAPTRGLLAEDAVIHGLTDEAEDLHGIAAFKKFYWDFRAGLSDIRVDVVDAPVDGDRIAARLLVAGSPPGSEQRVKFSGMVFVRLEGDKLVEGWNRFDFEGMREQLKRLQS